MSRPPRSDRPRSCAEVAKATAKGLTRRQFVIRSAATAAGAAVSTYGFSWGDLAYGQQLAGKPVSFNVAIRPDWTQGCLAQALHESRRGLGRWARALQGDENARAEWTVEITGRSRTAA